MTHDMNFLLLHDLIRKLTGRPATSKFGSSSSYWIERYAAGGDSGAGSYNHLAEFKADVINSLVTQYDIKSVIELGCGDGNQLHYANYPSYLGIDISPAAIAQCAAAFAADSSKKFMLLGDYRGEQAELALSLDVIYHLVEDQVFDQYMQTLYHSASRFIIIYSSNMDAAVDSKTPHIRHRHFSRWITDSAPNWLLIAHIPNRYPYNGDHTETTFSDFYIYGLQPQSMIAVTG